MGAEQFYTTEQGRTPEEAFRYAHERAVSSYGNRGYTGSLAEKDNFVVIPVPIGTNASAFANELLEKNDARISDKWGPAGCVLLASEDIHRIEKVPQQSTTATVNNYPHTGTRKWLTYHVLYADGKEIGKELKKADALKKGKAYAIQKGITVSMHIEKRLEGHSSLETEITANLPKPKEQKVTERLNTYAFFGWASS